MDDGVPIIIGVIVFIAALYFMYFAFKVLVIALVYGTLAAVGGALALVISSRIEAKERLTAETGSTLLRSGFALRIDFAQGIIACTQDSARLNKIASELRQKSSRSIIIACVCAAMLYVIPVPILINAYPNNDVLHFFDNDFPPVRGTASHDISTFALIFLAPLIIGGTIYGCYRYCTPVTFTNVVFDWASACERQFRSAVSPRLKEMSRLIGEIERAAAWTGFVFPTDADEQVGSAVERLKIDVLRSPQRLDEIVKEACDRCCADLTHLEEAKTVYIRATRAFEEAKREVLRTGSAILLQRLEPAHASIGSRELLGLVPRRRWSDFQGIVTAMMADIDAVKEDARRFTASTDAPPPSRDPVPSPLEQAYRTLGLPSTASAEQVDQVWHALLNAWHPDHGVADDSRTKELNNARDVIRKATRQA